MNVRYALACRRRLVRASLLRLRTSLRGSCKNPTNGSLWILQVQATNSGLTTLLIPQTAVCGYFKSGLLQQIENVVPERTLSCRSLDLNNPQTAGVTPVSETVAIPHFGLLFDSILLSCRINHSW